MRARLLELIVCPNCGAQLELERRTVDGDEIMSGTLHCRGCRRPFPIEDGVPRLLPARDKVSSDAQRTVDRFGAQWNTFDFLGPHYEWQFLQWIAPNTAEDFRGRIVLEGGCGKGRHSTLAAQFGAKEVLAIDLGSAVEAAFRNTRGHPAVHVIQADLFHLPVKECSIDLAFSLGVLHHTPDPRGCFLELVKVVRPGGKVIAWVYGAENNAWLVHGISPIRAKITSRLPHEWVYELSKIPAALLFAIGRGVYRPLSRPPLEPIGRRLFYHAYINYLAQFPYEEIHSIVHDHLTPPIAHYISQREFKSWFDDAGLTDVVIGWHNQNSWRGTGVRSAKARAVPLAVKAVGQGASAPKDGR
jgi:SAM-dependent methyltransferase